MEVHDRIIGVEKLKSVFGYWPSFHDAEVLWIHLDRSPSNETTGPTVEAAIHTFEMTSDVGPDGSYVLRNHVLVHFCFRGVVDLQIEGFNHQNALFGLRILDLRERGWEHIHYQVRFDPSFGVDASFDCHEIEILSVKPCDKEGVAADG